MSPERRAVIDALVAERYGPSLWWKTPPKEQPVDAELDQARRRRELDEAHGGAA